MKVLTLSALCNTRIVLFRLPRVLTSMERSSAEVCTHQPDSLLFTGPPGRGVSWGVLIQGEPHYLLNQHIIAMFHPVELFTSVFSTGNSLFWRAMTAFVSPWPRWLCVIWYAAIWLGRMSRVTGLHRPGPITSPLLFSLCFPLSPLLPPRSLCLCSQWMYPLACRCVNCFHLHCGQMGSSASVVISYAWSF